MKDLFKKEKFKTISAEEKSLKEKDEANKSAEMPLAKGRKIVCLKQNNSTLDICRIGFEDPEELKEISENNKATEKTELMTIDNA